jgi:hypothetical protein
MRKLELPAAIVIAAVILAVSLVSHTAYSAYRDHVQANVERERAAKMEREQAELRRKAEELARAEEQAIKDARSHQAWLKAGGVSSRDLGMWLRSHGNHDILATLVIKFAVKDYDRSDIEWTTTDHATVTGYIWAEFGNSSKALYQYYFNLMWSDTDWSILDSKFVKRDPSRPEFKAMKRTYVPEQ